MVSDKWLQENRGWYRVPLKGSEIQFLEGDDWSVDVGWSLGWTRKKTGTYSPFTDPGASAARFCFTYKPVENWRYMVIEAPNFSTPLGVSSKGASVMAQGGRPSATAGIWTVAWTSGPTTYAKWDAEIKALVIDPGYYVNKDWIVNMKYWSSARSGPVFSVSTVKLYKVGPPGGEGVPFPLFARGGSLNVQCVNIGNILISLKKGIRRLFVNENNIIDGGYFFRAEHIALWTNTSSDVTSLNISSENCVLTGKVAVYGW